MSGFSWVTLATNDSYSLGALVLAHSLKRVGTAHQLVVMVTPGVTQPMREKLRSVFDLVFEVNILDSKDERNLLLLQRPELGITFTKLHCWRLTQYAKCVFLDADTLVLQNCDELFDRDEFSAAPDVGWPDCFNSGVFVYKPSDETFNSLLTFALERGSFDGGDQGLLNLYFSDWAHKDISKHLPFIYNMCSTACYSYLPAFKQFGENVKIVHFIGNSKPWLQYFNSETLQVSCNPGFEHLQLVFEHWWNLFCNFVHSGLQANMGGLAGAFAQMTLREPRSANQFALEDHLRRQGWEAGRIDYLGQDSFDNVWKKICETMAAAPKKEPSPPKQITPAAEPSPSPATPITTEASASTIVEAPKSESTPVTAAAIIETPKSEPVPATPVKTPEVVPSAPEPAVVSASEPAVVSAPEPAVVSAPEPAVAPAPEPVVAPAPEPAVAPAPEPAVAPASEPAVAPALEPAVVSTPEPVVAPAPEPVVAPAPEPAVVSAPAPAVVSAPEPAIVSAPEPAVAPAPELTVVPTPKPVIAPAPEPTVASVPEPVVASVPEPVVASVPEPIATPASETVPVVASTPEAVPVATPTPEVTPVVTLAPEAISVAAAAPVTEPIKEATTDTKVTEPVAAETKVVPITQTEKKKSVEKPTSSVSEGKKETVKSKAESAEGQSSESTPVPPPRKSGKNGGTTAKKTTKKK